MKAKELKVGDLVEFNREGEKVETVTRRENHVYITTEFTRETGGMAYDLDAFQEV